MTELAAEKARLRQLMLQKRQELPAAVKLEAARSLALHYADHPYLTYAKSFAGYYAIKGEADVLPIFNHMARFRKSMALPRIEGDMLQFHCWQPGQPLEAGALGTKNPPQSHEIIMPEVILVPLLAFDATGNRLGYGGGYYDRTMHALRKSCEKPPLFVGVAYDMQEVDALPAEEHDAALDAILTNQGVSVFSRI